MNEPTAMGAGDHWRVFASIAELDAALATHLADELRADIDTRGSASLAVSGGNTPRTMFRLLSQQSLAWQQVALTLVDERWVGTEHEDSNEAMMRRNLHQHRAAQARLIGLKTPHARASEGVSEAGARIAALPRPFTCVVLGMGDDGHTASWFPQATNLPRLLDTQCSDLVAATEPVTATHARMTMTLTAVLASRRIIVHITGAEKKTVFNKAISSGYPIAAVLQQTHTPVTIWWAPND